MGHDGTMIHVNPAKRQNRRACDRCHQAKLKCVREGNRKCRRCERNDSECIFSPPTRLRNRQQSMPPSSSTTPFDSTDFQLDAWSNFDIDVALEPSLLATFGLDTGFPVPTGPTSHQDHNQDPAALNELVTPALSSIMSSGYIPSASVSAAHTVTGYDESPTAELPVSSGPAPSRTPSLALSTTLSSPNDDIEHDEKLLTNLVFWADKIAQLNIQFTQHLQSIPRVSSESLHNDKDSAAIPLPSGNHNSDRTFHLSESFVDILSGMCSKLQPPQTATIVANEDSQPAVLSLDEASYLMVFSTYLRFLETHDSVFRYLLACLVHKRETLKTGSCFYLPKLTIGSFSLARTSETRPLLFVSLMESMLTRARNLVHHMALVKSTSPGRRADQWGFGGSPPVIEPELALQAVSAKEAAISMSIERIKSVLSRLG
ncbi:hypothetical protein F4818DRAFT_430923 [Hypoxylon cercidicola]|nr:hypothetical protein F4818DRAFT_430923 [Hypoxylon cercidicola]